MKKNAVKNAAKSHLLFAPERKLIDPESAQRLASKCSDYNDSRSEARNFKCLEFHNAKFVGEDFSGIEAHYSRFEDCEFTECKFTRMEAHFASFENCTFTNCNLENGNFSFAKITETVFFNSNLDGADFPFIQGSNFSCTGCMMERASANNAADLHLILTQCNAVGFEANCSKIELDAATSCLRRAEFNDSTISGKVVQSDLTGAELNRSELEELEIVDCATSGMETEDASGVDNCLDNALEDALNELEEDIED